MQDHQPMQEGHPISSQAARRFPVSLVAALVAVVLAAGGGTAWWTWHSYQSNSEASPETNPPTQVDPSNPVTGSETGTTTEPSEPSGTVTVETTTQVYLVDVAGDRFELVPTPVQVEGADNPDEVLSGAFDQLLAGTVESAAFSEIPSGTELLGVSVESDGVHINLSSEFESGGGSASMTSRLAQVIYTASSLEPTTPVWLSIEGQPLEVLGGEGLLVDQPMTRAQFEENFSL